MSGIAGNLRFPRDVRTLGNSRDWRRERKREGFELGREVRQISKLLNRIVAGVPSDPLDSHICENVPSATLRQIWQNITQAHEIWDVPIYEEFTVGRVYDTVRVSLCKSAEKEEVKPSSPICELSSPVGSPFASYTPRPRTRPGKLPPRRL